MSSVLVFSRFISIFPMTTEINYSSRPFYLTAKLTKMTLVETSGLYLGLGSLVVMYNLKFGLKSISLSPIYIMSFPATFFRFLTKTGSRLASKSSSTFYKITAFPCDMQVYILLI